MHRVPTCCTPIRRYLCWWYGAKVRRAGWLRMDPYAVKSACANGSSTRLHACDIHQMKRSRTSAERASDEAPQHKQCRAYRSGECFQYTVSAADDSMRLKDLAARVFPTVASGTHAKRLIKAGTITRGGPLEGNAVESAARVREGDVIRLRVEPVIAVCAHRDETSLQRHIDTMKRGGLRVLHETEHFAAIFKPAGFHTMGVHWRCVDKALPRLLSPSSRADAKVPHPCHRLDCRVSGVVLCAKTHSAAHALGRQFQEHTLQKWYRAIVVGRVDVEHIARACADAGGASSEGRHEASDRTGCRASADGDGCAATEVAQEVARVASRFGAVAAAAPAVLSELSSTSGASAASGATAGGANADEGEQVEQGSRGGRGSAVIDFPIAGKAARTLLRVVAHTPSDRVGCLTTLDLFPHTGRKHQLRAHLAAAGYPILGDDLYPTAAAAQCYMRASADHDQAESDGNGDALEAKEDGTAEPCSKSTLRGRGLFLQSVGIHFCTEALRDTNVRSVTDAPQGGVPACSMVAAAAATHVAHHTHDGEQWTAITAPEVARFEKMRVSTLQHWRRKQATSGAHANLDTMARRH